MVPLVHELPPLVVTAPRYLELAFTAGGRSSRDSVFSPHAPARRRRPAPKKMKLRPAPIPIGTAQRNFLRRRPSPGIAPAVAAAVAFADSLRAAPSGAKGYQDSGYRRDVPADCRKLPTGAGPPAAGWLPLAPAAPRSSAAGGVVVNVHSSAAESPLERGSGTEQNPAQAAAVKGLAPVLVGFRCLTFRWFRV